MTVAGGSLVVNDLRVEFDGFVAVDGVSFDAHPGEVRFLIGPNGAGKTTCIDAITGLSKGTGSVTLGDQELLGKSTQKIVRLGVGRTFQTASVFEQLSVLQNLDIAAGLHRSSLSLLRARRGVDPAIELALEETGLSDERETPAGILSHGQKQWLEIGMMLVQEPRALLLDEPVAGMSQDERTATGELLQRIAKRRIVLVVEHDMDFMRRYASRVTVLHQGKLLSEGSVAQVQADPKVQEVYLGTAGAATTAAMLVVADSTTAVTDAATQGRGPEMLELNEIQAGYGRTLVLHGVTLPVSDKVVAVLGHNGAGKSTLLRVAIGLIKPRSGQVIFDGEDVTSLAPNKRVARGMAYVPQGQQSFPQLTTMENLQLVADGRKRGKALIEQQLVAVPRAGEVRHPQGRPALGRPASAARDRPGAHHRAEAAHPRRADRGHSADDRRRDRADGDAARERRAFRAARRAAHRLRAGGCRQVPRARERLRLERRRRRSIRGRGRAGGDGDLALSARNASETQCGDNEPHVRGAGGAT